MPRSRRALARARLHARRAGLLADAEAFFAAGLTRRRIWRVGQAMTHHRVWQAASAMAFDLFLAAIPMIALAGWLFSVLLRDPRSLASASQLLDLTPYEVHDLVLRHLDRFSAGAVAPLALLGALWLASSAFHTLMAVFETAVHARRRSYWKKRVIAMACVAVAIAAIALSGYIVVIVAGGPLAIVRWLEVADEGASRTAGSLLAVLFALFTATALLALFYRIAVHRPGVRRRVWPGAAVTVAIGSIVSAAFGYYARELARFTLFYGSLAAVAVTLAWLWLWCVALLLGAEINAELETEDTGAVLRRARRGSSGREPIDSS
jgi:membrane protein